jgi:hypothetical protein
MAMATKSPSLLIWLNIVAFVLTVTVNALAGGTNLIGGVNTAQVSNSNPTLITPPGYVFSIWGIIYLLLGVFVVFQALPSQKGKEYQKKIGWLFVLSCIFNISWIFVWQYQLISISVVVIFLLLASLIVLYRRLGVGINKVKLSEKLAVQVPLSVYLGWITIASIANVSVALVSIGWSGFGIAPEAWASFIVIIASLIGLLVVVRRKDTAYGLVFIWAFTGIAMKQGADPNISFLTESGAAIILIALIALLFFDRCKKR